MGPTPAGVPRQDKVSQFKTHNRTQIRYKSWNREYHVLCISHLSQLVIDFAPNINSAGVSEIRRRNVRTTNLN